MERQKDKCTRGEDYTKNSLHNSVYTLSPPLLHFTTCLYILFNCVKIKDVSWNNTILHTPKYNKNSRSIYKQNGCKNKTKFLLTSRADKPPFAQTRYAQTERSVTAASAKLVTKLGQGSSIRPVIDAAVFQQCFTWNITRQIYYKYTACYCLISVNNENRKRDNWHEIHDK